MNATCCLRNNHPRILYNNNFFLTAKVASFMAIGQISPDRLSLYHSMMMTFCLSLKDSKILCSLSYIICTEFRFVRNCKFLNEIH
jgi:hypothetical protein